MLFRYITVFVVLLIHLGVCQDSDPCEQNQVTWNANCLGDWTYDGYGITSFDGTVNRCASPEVIEGFDHLK